MTQEQHRRGSAAIALRRLAHPGRDGGVVGEDDQLSEVTRRLSELLAVVEHRTAEIDDRAGPRPTESVAPSVLVRATPTPQDDDTGTATISLRFDTQMLSRVDAAAKRPGSAARCGCILRPESSWGTGDSLPRARASSTLFRFDR
jgi:hypothetical protein